MTIGGSTFALTMCVWPGRVARRASGVASAITACTSHM